MCIAHNYANAKHDPKLNTVELLTELLLKSVYINEIKLVTENPLFL